MYTHRQEGFIFILTGGIDENAVEEPAARTGAMPVHYLTINVFY